MQANHLDVFPRTSRNELFDITESWLQTVLTLNATWKLFPKVVCYIAICPMMPRFVISMRELYHRDLRGRSHGIDSGFGMLSQRLASQDGVESTIAFAAIAPGQSEIVEGGVDESEAIPLEVLGDSTRRV